MPVNQGGNAGSSRPFYQGMGAIFVAFFPWTENLKEEFTCWTSNLYGRILKK